jgi:hypothetical protein
MTAAWGMSLNRFVPVVAQAPDIHSNPFVITSAVQTPSRMAKLSSKRIDLLR